MRLRTLARGFSRTALCCIAALVLTAGVVSAAPRQQTTVNICDRTPEVHRAIFAALNLVGDCRAVPSSALDDVTALFVEGYSAASIDSADFADLPRLSVLQIWNSLQLTTVSEDAFGDAADTLVDLDIRNNQISSIDEDAFDGFSAMQAPSLGLGNKLINLGGNQLESLPADIFDGLTALTHVYLGGNQLESLPADVFDGLTRLVYLELHHNQLSSLDADIFDGLTALEEIELYENQITSLDADVFDDLPALTFLRLFDNQITSLPADAFDGTALATLDLNGNRISLLHADAFDGLSALHWLDLGDNPVSSLPVGIFDGLTELAVLDLYCNSLTELDLSVFDPIADNAHFNLDIRGSRFTTSPSETAIRAKFTDRIGLITGPYVLPCRNVTPGLTFSPTSLTVAEGSSGMYTVALATEPTGDVMVAISSDNTDVMVSPSPLTFTATTWGTVQTVTVSADQDADMVDDVVTLTHDPSGADYASVSNTALTVVVEDDDVPAVAVRFGNATHTAAEGSSVTVTVELNADPERTVTIPIKRSNQNGASNGDYSGVPANVTFNSGDTSETFTFAATQDTVDDDGESVLLGFGTLPGRVSAGTPSTSTVSIADDDVPAVTVSFGSATYTVVEGGSVTVTVALSESPERTVAIPITRSNRGGATNSDYSGVPASVTFNSGDTRETFTFAAAQDTVADDGESVLLGFGTLPTLVTAGSPATSTASITDNDDPSVTVRFGSATYAATEGSSVTVTVELSADPERTVTIPITRSNRGGASNSDYSGIPASVTFNSGDTSETFTFAAAQDTVDDGGESVLLGFGTLPALVSARTPSTASVSITDVPAVMVSFRSATHTVGEGGSATITVELSADPERTVTIPIRRSNQNGASNADYSGVPASVRFNSGDTRETFTFAAAQDTVDDDGESVWLGFGTLPTGVSTGARSTSTVSITDDDDPAVTVSFRSATHTVGEGGSATITVELSADPERSVAVPITRSNRGGASDGDYSGVPANVTFNSGDTRETFTFAATQDTVDDDGESVRLGFGTPPTGVNTGTPSTSTVSITDDDDPSVTVRFGSATYTTAEGDGVTVTVELSDDPERSVTIPITRLNQNGASNADYSGVPASVRFNSGDTSRTFTFSATDDTGDDDGESVRLSLGTLPAGVSAGTPSTSSVSITDNDDPPVTVSFGSATYTAAEGGNVTVTVTLDADPERSVTVPITRSNRGGATDADYSGVPASVTFDSGDTSRTFTFAATDDTDDDDGESVRLSFGTLPARVTAGSTATSTVSITDDDVPTVSVRFGAATYTAAEGGSVTVTVALSESPERSVTIPITTNNLGGATTADYSGVPSNVTFGSGDTSETFSFAATQDTVDDDGESVRLAFGTLPPLVTEGSPATSTVSIADNDDPAVTVSFESATYTAAEGGSVTVTMELSADPERTVTIPLTATGEGGATGGDYSIAPSVTFNSGDTSETFTFAATQDTVDDDGESVQLGFGRLPTDVAAGTTATSTVSITDDDDPSVTVSFRSATYTVGEGANVTVTVELSADPERTVTVPLTATGQGGATDGDYSIPASVTFSSGDTSETFTFAATDDAFDDDGERVRLGFGGLPLRVSTGARGMSTVSITDDDDPAVTVMFRSATYTAAEGGGVTVTVELSADPERSVTVPITTNNLGGATDGDYSVPSSVTFSSGDTSETFTFAATDDTDDDDEESVRLGFGALPTDVTVGSTATSTVSITDDDDPAVTVSFRSGTYTVGEGGSVTVTVELSADPERTVTVPIRRSNEGGASNADYSGVPARVRFNSGDTSQTFTFAATDDTGDDDGESVRLSLGTLPARVTAGGTATSTVSITDDDDPEVRVSFSQAAYSVAEGDDVTVTVELSADPERSVTVPITTNNLGGATAADYSGVPASVTFSSGDTSETFTFSATQDGVDDDGESVRLAFGTLPTLVTEGSPATSTVSITDNDDPSVTISFGSATYTAAEGGSVTVTVELNADPERTVTIPLMATGQDGATDGDYSIPAGVTFNRGDTSETFTFSATHDTDDDDGESVRLSFGTLPARVTEGSPAASTVSITDDDDPEVTVSFGAASYTAAEGGSVTVTVELNADPERSVTIPVTTSNLGGATGGDYSGVPANVTFNRGDTSETFTFSAAQDGVDDDGESVRLGFGGLPLRVSTGARGTSTVSITDDDDPSVTVMFRSATYTAAEGGGVTVTVELSADPERSVTIPLTATGQDGASSSDYSGVPSSVTFDSGDTSETFTFAATDDAVDDDGESVLLGFGTPPARVTEGSPATSVVSITDDDDPSVTVRFGVATYTAAEGGSVSVTVTLSADPERSVTIPITSSEQDGATDADYSGVPSNLTFDTGETTKAFTFRAAQDTVDDDGESVLLGFGTLPMGVTAGSPAASAVSITDDDDPEVTVSFSQAAYSAAEGGSVIVTVELSEDPERTVTIPLTRSNQNGASNGDYSGVPASVAFNSGQTSETFTFAAADDSVDDDGESVLLRFGALPARVSRSMPETATVNITDDDGSGVRILPASLEVGEGTTETYTVVLDSQPTADVTVTPSISRGSGFSFTPASLVFTTDTWSAPRVVTVTGTSDADALDHDGVISHAVASADGNYRGTASSVSVTVVDDEDIPVTVRFEQGSYDVAEGGSVTVKVLLSADPERTVTIPVTRSNQGTTTDADYSGVPDSVTFNAGETESSINVAATQDEIDDDGESVLLGFASLPNAVTAGTPAETTLNIGDDDDAEVTVSFEHATYTANEGSGVTVTVVLSAEPEREVVVPLTATNQDGAVDDDYSGVPPSVTFNARDTERTFTFTAAQDTVDDGGESVRLGFGALPARVTEGGTPAAIVGIADDDTRGVRVGPTQLTFAEGGSGTYTVVLNTQPTSTVTVTVNDPADNTDVTAEPPSLTFTTDDWNEIQRVTVSATRDTDATNDVATVTHSVSGGDYESVSAADVTVTVAEVVRSPVRPTPPTSSGSTGSGGGGEGGGGAPRNVAPVFVEGSETTRTVAENAEPGTPVGDPVVARDPDSNSLVYSLGGVGRDKESFSVDPETGQLLTAVALDYEQKNLYDVVVGVQADDGSDFIRVSIQVNDQEPEPTATPTPAPPTATPTPRPPTATPTAVPTATPTRMPPTATPTPESTSTPTRMPTATSTPAPTSTPVPTPTATAAPEPTATPMPGPIPVVEPPDEGGGWPWWLWLVLVLLVAALVMGGLVYVGRQQ